MTFPVKLYVDFISPDGECAVTDTKTSAIYNVHKINEIRNFTAKTNIPLEVESPFIRAGKYICIKSCQEDMVSPKLFFYDFTDYPELFNQLSDSIKGNDNYVLNEIRKYISENYAEVSKEVLLVKEIPSFVSLD